MKYIWIIILIICDLIWGIYSFSDIMVCIKSYKSDGILDMISELLDNIKDATQWFFIVHILILFFTSFTYFIMGK